MDTIKNHSFKIQIGTALAVLLFMITSVWFMSAEINTMKSGIDECHEQMETNKEHIISLEAAASARDLVLVEVRVKLANIETLLTDIRLQLN